MSDESIVYEKDAQEPAGKEFDPAKTPAADRPAKQTPEEAQAKADLLKTSGGDPFTQEGD